MKSHKIGNSTQIASFKITNMRIPCSSIFLPCKATRKNPLYGSKNIRSLPRYYIIMHSGRLCILSPSAWTFFVRNQAFGVVASLDVLRLSEEVCTASAHLLPRRSQIKSHNQLLFSDRGVVSSAQKPSRIRSCFR
jgi:hypothetical protein